MFVTITDDMSDEILYQRTLEDHEILDCDAFADWFAAEYFDSSISYGGHVPLGCGQITVELADYPRTGSCWSTQSYFVN